MLKNKIFEIIDELYPVYLDVWEDVCNIESPTLYKEGVDAVGKYIINMANERGWKVEISRQEIVGDAVCITMNPDAKGTPICLSGHTDTVHPVGAFGTPAVHRDGERIYGPGVEDCKGGIVVALLAMDALHKIGFNERPIKLILQSDEENSSVLSNKKTVEFMCEKAKGARAFFNLEGSGDENGELCLKRKGILVYEFRIKGVPGHASRCATVGANAILEAAHKIVDLEKFKNADGITCCCSVINGGTVSNTIPEHCTFRANIRFATCAEQEWMENYVQKIASECTVPGTSCVAERISVRPPMELVDRNIEFLNDINKIYAENGMDTFKIGSRLGGSDAAYTTIAGIPTIDNIGPAGGNIHALDEYGVLKSLKKMAKYIAIAIVYL